MQDWAALAPYHSESELGGWWRLQGRLSDYSSPLPSEVTLSWCPGQDLGRSPREEGGLWQFCIFPS